MQSKSKIRKITEKDGKVSVSFFSHDGYFHVVDNEMSDFLVGMLKTALETNQEIEFEYDQDLNINEIIV